MRLPLRRSHGFAVPTFLALAAFASALHAADATPAPAAATPPTKGPATKGGGRGGNQNQPTFPQWWREIDTGPFISDTILQTKDGAISALKGVAIKLGDARDVSVVFDTELVAWRAGFEGAITLEGTAWNGSHGGNSHYPVGESIFFFENPNGLGTALNGSWTDVRDPKSGPLPQNVARHRGLYRHGNQVVVHYTVGNVKVLELPAVERIGDTRAITRTVNLADNHEATIELLVRDIAPPATILPTPPANYAGGGPAPAAPATDAPPPTPIPNPAALRLKKEADVYLVGAAQGVSLETDANGRAIVRVAKGTPANRFKIVYAERPLEAAALHSMAAPADLTPLTQGGPGLFPQTFAVKGQLDPNADTKTYAVDLVPLPAENPWKSPTRFGGFDFFPDGKRIAASTWNGDVWIADGIDGDLANVTWKRFASGLYQTLGLKIVNGVIYTQGRDQITRLRDVNGDGEADAYECFNNDVRITTGFHEFSFDLQTDAAGNFYFSKGMPVLAGGRGFAPWTPHNGTVMKVSPDGLKLEVVAWGLRAPGGVAVSPDGVITTGENEGSYVPQCKITWTPPGKLTFNGVIPSKWERATWAGPLPGAPTDYDKPLMWFPYNADNSSGSQAWVPQNTKWDPRHAGEMLHLSYGKSSIFRVMREEVNGQVQGGAYRLPIDISAAAMRTRWHPTTGQLYVIGFRGWQTNGRDALQRVRYTGVNNPLPVGLSAHANGIAIRFSSALDPKTAEDPSRYSISKWNYVWGPQYGTGRFSIDQRDVEAETKALTVASKGSVNNIDTVTVGAAKLLDDGRTVFLYLPKMTAAMQMEVKLDLADPKGAKVRETIYSTVHEMAAPFQIRGIRWEDIKVADAAPVGERGLVMTFDSETTDAVRVDQLALHVPANASPSVFLPPRAFGAAWQGTLVVPERDEFTFSFEGNGNIALQIDGKTVLSGDLPLAAKVPVTLSKGAHAIYASYRSPREGASRVRLLWSSPQFRTEPVPASAFRHLPNSDVELWGKVRAGRELFADAHCVKCHQPRNGNVLRDATPELLATTPSLQNVGARLNHAWLAQWIAQPTEHCPNVAGANAADIAAHLAEQKDAAWKSATPPADPAAVAAGAALVEKLHLGFWVEPLTKARKHTDGGLIEFLQKPALHYADTTFPDVRLSNTEAAQIAAYIRSRQPQTAKISPGNAANGATAFAASCAACHVTAPTNGRPAPGAAAAAPEARRYAGASSLEEMLRADWTVKGCVAVNRGKAPDLGLDANEISALIAFRNADRDVGIASLRRFAPTEYVTNQMKHLNCAQCHSGGSESKIPDITFAGEKLDHAWLEKLFAGKHPNRIRPYMETRMPAFASRANNLALGLAAKHGVTLKSDEGAVAGPATPTSPEQITLGGKLALTEGYSCIACHDVGNRKALAVFEGQGPNLQEAPERLRYDYFQRWMHWPQRIAPSTIMPRYTKDRDNATLEAHAAGNAEKQFDAIWHWARTLKAGGQ